MRKKNGFTLIELLIVIAVVAILAAVVFVALNPLGRFRDARDATRWSDVSAMLDAVKVDQVDNGGAYLASIAALTDDLYYTVGTCAVGGDAGCTAQTTQAACADLSGLISEGYLAEIPMDPSSGTAALTDYYLQKSAAGAITIGSCDPEGGSAINVNR